MAKIHIYLSGAMSGLSQEEQSKWRYEVAKRLQEGEIYHDGIYVFNPVNYYSIFEDTHKTEREHFEFDLYRLRNSNLVIANFNRPESVGTAMELMLAKELRIPVIGLNEDGKELHPWLKECCVRICDDMYELVEYVVEYFLK